MHCNIFPFVHCDLILSSSHQPRYMNGVPDRPMLGKMELFLPSWLTEHYIWTTPYTHISEHESKKKKTKQKQSHNTTHTDPRLVNIKS